jgi:hypothetical protein
MPAIISGLIIFTWVLSFAVDFLPDIEINELLPTIFYGGIFLVAWVTPVALGVKSAKHKGISPHWMWFGIYPITAWIAFLLIRFVFPLAKKSQSASTQPLTKASK